MNEAASGRPVRFFAFVMAGWVLIRLASPQGDIWVYPEDGQLRRPERPKIWSTSARNDAPLHWKTMVRHRQTPPASGRREPSYFASPAGESRTAAVIPISIRVADVAATSMPSEDHTAPTDPPVHPAPAIPLALPQTVGNGRWHGSLWLLWREGGATRADAVSAGRLGGSQAGGRIDFDLTPHASSRATAYARASAALNRPASPEAALGLAWQPARRIPVSVATERRIALGQGGRNANAVMVVGGIGPMPIAPSLEVAAYAQGGMVGFRSNDLFVDGKISLLSTIGRSPLRLGASLSGGAQPQVERLDVGPEIQVRLPLKPVAARLGIEWRERIAGRAAPASGLAVTLGADF
ncbi:hypothetical protein CAF53_02870 [Sphingobium sp. LB126]|uniref:hypothetical protein n=1 Tax=Sphingobium sp. LB126 TaxID=1983755 RepID=UPI000C1FF6C8|nr:hypothetical protein [Sphingobium sp. LB126]PJG47296.1 hypothetical protein CAF53_02870 [Sphingobium sp. LB126]